MIYKNKKERWICDRKRDVGRQEPTPRETSSGRKREKTGRWDRDGRSFHETTQGAVFKAHIVLGNVDFILNTMVRRSLGCLDGNVPSAKRQKTCEVDPESWWPYVLTHFR